VQNRTVFLVFILVLSLIIAASGDTAIPETPETQGIDTDTMVDNLGITTETNEMVWQESNFVMDASLFDPRLGKLVPTMHALYTTSYQEDTIADQGLTSYTKSVALDTRGKVENQYNFETQRIVSFLGSDTGLLTSDESTLLDGAGTPFPDWAIMTCPFAAGTTGNPSFCNIVEMGSDVSLEEGTLTAGTEERHVVAANHFEYIPSSYGIPISDPGVEENYDIRVTGLEATSFAAGRADAYLNAHIMEGRLRPVLISEYPLVFDNRLAEDIVYNEMTTASGAITLFQKSMSYNSKITGRGFPAEAMVV